MIRVSELSGAWLDYWVARAEGIPAEDLQVRQIQRSEGFHCVHGMPLPIPGGVFRKVRVLNYSTSWSLAGPIIDRERPELVPTWPDGGWYVRSRHRPCDGDQFYGETAMVAAMRAFVASKFGEEVPEVTP